MPWRFAALSCESKRLAAWATIRGNVGLGFDLPASPLEARPHQLANVIYSPRLTHTRTHARTAPFIVARAGGELPGLAPLLKNCFASALHIPFGFVSPPRGYRPGFDKLPCKEGMFKPQNANWTPYASGAQLWRCLECCKCRRCKHGTARHQKKATICSEKEIQKTSLPLGNGAQRLVV